MLEAAVGRLLELGCYSDARRLAMRLAGHRGKRIKTTRAQRRIRKDLGRRRRRISQASRRTNMRASRGMRRCA